MSNKRRSVLLLGATGLVGRECLRLLIDDPSVWRAVVLVRRPIEAARLPDKVQVQVVNFDALPSHRALFHVDSIICALGTTIKQAGSREAFRRVDYEYPLVAARLGLDEGARQFLLVSSLGASAASRFFYTRTKGELEDALRTLPYRGVTILRPSLLVGNRKPFRLGEEVGKRIGWILPGKYKPIAASAVAAALVTSVRHDEPGLTILETDEIRRLAEVRAPR